MEFNYKDNRPYEVKIRKKDIIRAFKNENNYSRFVDELIEKLMKKQ